MKKPIHPIRNMIIGVVVLLCTIGLVFGVRYVTHLSFLNVTEVVVIGGETINQDVVKGIVERQLEGEYLKLIPHRFVWLYPHDAIVANVNEVERIYNVRVTRHEKTLTVQFDEYAPYALWCTADAGSRCVFLTEDGYGFAPAPQLSGGSFVRFMTLGRQPTPGTIAIPADDFQLLNDLIDRLATKGWFVELVEFDKERDAFVHLASGSELKITLRVPIQETLTNLETILGSEQFTHLEPGNFAYIDLRFGEKVFVNEHGTPDEMVATSTASSTEQ